MKVLMVGNGGVSKGFQKVFTELGTSFDIYDRSFGDLYEMPQKINTQYDMIIYAVGDIVWKPVRNNTTADIEKVFKPNTFGFVILAHILPRVLARANAENWEKLLRRRFARGTGVRKITEA